MLLATTLDAIYAEILAHPEEDIHRHAYADHLEEYGDDDAQLQAELIRIQLATASGRESYLPSYPFPLAYRENSIFSVSADAAMHADLPLWRLWLPGKIGGWSPSCLHVDNPLLLASFTRGFVSSIKCPQAIWLAHGKSLVRHHPIEEVRLSDREPNGDPIPTSVEDMEYTARWVDFIPPHLPDHICDRTPNCLRPELSRILADGGFPGQHPHFPWWFKDAASAHAALSRACILFAREF